MARPLSPEKRNALLQAATQAVAEHGAMATTSSIARGAGVAEGTLFTYFENKEVLFRELYLHLKESLATSVMPSYPQDASYRQRMEHVFQHYVSWGLANTAGRFAVSRLAATGLIPEQTRERGMEPFLAVSRMMSDGVREGALVDAPVGFLSSVIEHIADTTIVHVSKYPESADHYRELGFRILWRAITP